VPVLAQLLAQLEADGSGTYDQNVHGFSGKFRSEVIV